MEYGITVSPYQRNIVDTHLSFKQQDHGQVLCITVDNYDTTDMTAKIVFRRYDGVNREYDITQTYGVYRYTLSADDTYSVGKVVVDLKFYKAGVRESTASFIYEVIADETAEHFVSGDYSDSLQQALEQCQEAIDNVNNALLEQLHIYNGTDKNVAGYAADARQLNENVANSYAETIKNRIGTLANLTTTAKGNLVAAINELKSQNATLNNNLENVSMHYPYSGTQKIVNGEYAGIMQINSWGLVFDYVSPSATHRLQIAPDGKIWHGMSNDNGITWQHGEHISNGWG